MVDFLGPNNVRANPELSFLVGYESRHRRRSAVRTTPEDEWEWLGMVARDRIVGFLQTGSRTARLRTTARSCPQLDSGMNVPGEGRKTRDPEQAARARDTRRPLEGAVDSIEAWDFKPRQPAHAPEPIGQRRCIDGIVDMKLPGVCPAQDTLLSPGDRPNKRTRRRSAA
jgi:hypothetical protein